MKCFVLAWRLLALISYPPLCPPFLRLVFSQSLISLDLIEDFLELAGKAREDDDKPSPYRSRPPRAETWVAATLDRSGHAVTRSSNALCRPLAMAVLVIHHPVIPTFCVSQRISFWPRLGRGWFLCSGQPIRVALVLLSLLPNPAKKTKTYSNPGKAFRVDLLCSSFSTSVLSLFLIKVVIATLFHGWHYSFFNLYIFFILCFFILRTFATQGVS